MADLFIVDLNPDGTASVTSQLGSDLPDVVAPFGLTWPLDDGALDELRWYLEDYLILPSGVYGERGVKVQASLTAWGTRVFAAIFGGDPARDAYQRMRFRSSETRLVLRSADPRLLALPLGADARPGSCGDAAGPGPGRGEPQRRRGPFNSQPRDSRLNAVEARNLGCRHAARCP